MEEEPFCTRAENRVWATYNADTLNDERLSGIGFRTLCSRHEDS